MSYGHTIVIPNNAIIQATMIDEAAFWGLMLPTSVGSHIADIWRSYIWQVFFFLNFAYEFDLYFVTLSTLLIQVTAENDPCDYRDFTFFLDIKTRVFC